MKKTLGTLTAVFALLAVAGCGKKGDTEGTPTGSASNLTEPTSGATSNDALAEEENDVAPAAAQGSALPISAAPQRPEADATIETEFDARNSSFTLEGQAVVLKSGLSKIAAAPGSASLVTTRYLGKSAHGDLNRDGKEDVAYFVTREGAGSGTFYYVVAAINGKKGYKTTNAFFVGDRIDAQSLRINSNELQVIYVGRRKDDPMTEPPSRDSVLLLKVTSGGVLEGLMK